MKKHTEPRARYRLMVRSLSERYHDPCELLLHVPFQILCNFVEKEKPEESVNWDFTPEHQQARKEFRSLYYWWKIGRPAAQKHFMRLISKEFSAKTLDWGKQIVDKKILLDLTEFEDKLDKIDKKQLHRLVEIRGFLWT